MIHNNFRKFTRKIAGVTASGIDGYIDINGNTKQSGDSLTNDSYIKFYSGSQYQYSNSSYANILNFSGSAYMRSVPYAWIGKSAEVEQDYTLGEIISDNLTATTSNSASSNLLMVTTLTNVGNTDIVFDEVGLFLHLFAGTWQGVSSAKAEFLLLKEKLDESITLGAGESVAITFNLFADEVTIEEA